MAIDLFAVQNEALCTNFAITGLQAGDEPRGRALAQMGLAARLQIETIAAGRDNPVTRAAPTERMPMPISKHWQIMG